MKCQSIVLSGVLLWGATGAWSQIKWPNELTVWFPDGTGIEIHTEVSGSSSPLSTSGSVASWGKDSHRVVLGWNGAILFGYDIEAQKAGEGTFTVRIKPSREAIRMTCCVDGKKTVEYMATVAAVREFPLLKIGDAVQVDILYNPGTGEKIYDVLKVSGYRSPSPEPAKAPRQRFSLRDVRVTIDGKQVVEQQGIWMVGGGLMIRLPGRGEFYLTPAPPPPDLPRFQPAGWADHDVLRFHSGSELVEVSSKTNVLQGSDYGTVWVYRKASDDAERLRQRAAMAKSTADATLSPKLAALDKAGIDLAVEKKLSRSIEFQCADDVESLLRKR